MSIEGLKYRRLCIGNTHARRVDNAISKKAVNKKDLRATPARQVVKKLQDSILTTCAADVQISGKSH